MAKVLLHCPLNISRSLEEMIREISWELQRKYDLTIDIIAQPHRPQEDSLFELLLRKKELPDLIIGHINEFANLPAAFINKYFSSVQERFHIRKELADLGFADKKGFFHLFAVIPFAMFYNKNILNEQEIPHSWVDILEDKWQQKIYMPDQFRIVSTIIRSFMKATYPERFASFQKNVVCKGSPVDVVKAINNGEYPIGITNIAFARISRNENTRLIWPADGMFCMPQVMVWSKEADQALLEIGDFLLSAKVQEYMALQGFIPVSEAVTIPKLITDNGFKLHWKDWKHYLALMRERNI